MLYKHFEICTYSLSQCDCYALTESGYVVQVLNIIDNLSKVILLCKQFQKPYKPFYKYPFSSEHLHIYVINAVSSEMIMYDFNEIKAKCILFPNSSDDFIAFPLLHSYVLN